MMLAVFVVLSLTATSSLGALIPILGQCPSVKPVAGFELEKFAGTWYEIESTPVIHKVGRRCSQFSFEFKDSTSAGLFEKYFTKLSDKQHSDYSDVINVKNEPGKLDITPQKTSMLHRKWSMTVLDTDYTTFAIGYYCQKGLLAKAEEIYVLSRTKELDDKTKMNIYDTLKKNSINQKLLNEVDQKHKDCKETD